ncbi:MAG: helix-turn-helix domain-containing protein [Planctomycetaceae bacterium]|nr:helix-turn-helix domain-containing protein [Planctomycetaceae bacterium]
MSNNNFLPMFDDDEIAVVSQRSMESLLTVRQVANILKLSPEAVRIEIKRKKIKASRVGPKGGVLRVRPDWRKTCHLLDRNTEYRLKYEACNLTLIK